VFGRSQRNSNQWTPRLTRPKFQCNGGAQWPTHQERHLIVALDALGDDAKLTMELTKSRPLQEEQRKSERNMRQTSVVKGEYASALVSNTKFTKFDGTWNARGELTCHHCSKPGHIARYCRSTPNFGQDCWKWKFLWVKLLLLY
jgi:hypothetical protein